MNFRRKIIPFFTVLLAALFLIPACPALSENLLRNADFRELDQDGLPADWFTDAYVLETGYSVFSVSEGDPEHTVSAEIQNIGDNDARFAQTVEVEPDSIYLLSGYIRAENVAGGHGANLSVEGVYAFSEKVYDTMGEWQHIEYYGETGPEQDSLTVFARLGGYSGVSTGKAWFADLSLTKVESIPGDGIADLWYKEQSYENEDVPDDGSENNEPGAAWPWLVLSGLAYSFLCAVILYRMRTGQPATCTTQKFNPAATACLMLIALAVRLVLCWFVEGYMIDVNCYLSWGRTMAYAGPAGFYEATSFCDYPPLYTYILGLNSLVSDLFGGGAAVSRVVYRFVPCLCDLIGYWLLYMLLLRQEHVQPRSCLLIFLMTAFNPAIILNSAAWGQMDSVLCLLLLAVALTAEKGKWKIALPLYVIAVLVKPQALMLGPLGLAYIIVTWIKSPESRKEMFYAVVVSILVMAACIIPFSLRQSPDWLIQLYGRTLSSYPYATVNTANFWYLLGGNWNAVGNSAHVTAPILLSLLTAVYGCWWFRRTRSRNYRWIETLISFSFTLSFISCACAGASWAWTGGLAMAFVFVIVLSPAIRSGKIILLPWLGALLFLLLYVFGVKMHERYVFPALLLLAAAWVRLRDRRILYVFLLYTFTLFVNEGIILDNSIRLGSALGHLNRDTVWLADIISVLNIAGAVYAVRISTDLFLQENSGNPAETKPHGPMNWSPDRKLYWNRKDTLLLAVITVVYSVISLLTLGSAKAPQTGWSSSSADEMIIFDLGQIRNDFEILYFARVSRSDFSFSVSEDGETWEDETWAQMDQGQCWKWKYVTSSVESLDGSRTYYNSDENDIVRFTGRYVRLTSQQLGLRLNEVLFRSRSGNILPVSISERIGEEKASTLYSAPGMLIDEQDSMEGLPSFPETAETSNSKIQPSWWNSTYFDEIYHARTAFEFLQGTVPYETSHPPLGKVLMSACIAVFGMTPFGWRFAGALAGILMLPGMYLLGKQLTKKTSIAVLSCLMMALDTMHLTQTQIATIDSFPVLFIIFAYFFMLRFIQTDFIREKLSVSLIPLGLSGLFMGLSIASKWIGIYAGAGLSVLFFWHCIRMIRLQRSAAAAAFTEQATDIERHNLNKWNPINGEAHDAFRRTIVLCEFCILFFILVPVLIYLVSYIPYLAYNARKINTLWDYIDEVWRCQLGMFSYHSTPNLGMDHPFYSPWWEWPVIGKPMYYASQQYIPPTSPVHYSIFCFGNPVIWFGALAALSFCVFRAAWNRRYRISGEPYLWHVHSTNSDPRYAFILIGLLAQYLPWVLVPRGTYIYHYFASLPFLMLAICLSFDGHCPRDRNKAAFLGVVFATAAAVFFVLLFPYASGIGVSAEWLDIGKKLLRIWY